MCTQCQSIFFPLQSHISCWLLAVLQAKLLVSFWGTLFKSGWSSTVVLTSWSSPTMDKVGTSYWTILFSFTLSCLPYNGSSSPSSTIIQTSLWTATCTLAGIHFKLLRGKESTSQTQPMACEFSSINTWSQFQSERASAALCVLNIDLWDSMFKHICFWCLVLPAKKLQNIKNK